MNETYISQRHLVLSVIKIAEPEPPIPDKEGLEQIAGRGRELFQKHYDELRQYPGHVVAIDLRSEDYFVGRDGTEAMKQAEERYPGQLFYLEVIPRGPKRRTGHQPPGIVEITLRDAIRLGLLPPEAAPAEWHTLHTSPLSDVHQRYNR